MGYEPKECVEKLKEKGLVPPCDGEALPYHCDSFQTSAVYHAFCYEEDMYTPVSAIMCKNYKTGEIRYFPPDSVLRDCAKLNPKHSDPDTWEWDTYPCFCCCSCFASETLVMIPGGNLKPILDIAVGDDIMAARVQYEPDKLQINWTDTKVRFSAGSGPGNIQEHMVYLLLGEGLHDLICSPDQVFLLADGTFNIAGKLVPTQELVDMNGKAVKLNLVSIGRYNGGVHHVSTSNDWTGSPNDHLILAGGVVAGDFELQTHFNELPDTLKAPGHHTLPMVGMPEYEQVLPNGVQRAGPHFIFMEAGTEQQPDQIKIREGRFKAYYAVDAQIPYGAQSLLTNEQSEDVLDNGKQTDLSNKIPIYLFETIKKQLAGFFPEINFYYDAVNLLPNVYAYEHCGKKFVVVTGGLARLIDFNYEGLAMAMAHGASRFSGFKPKNAFGYSAVGTCDFIAFGPVSRNIWIQQPWSSYIKGAWLQWKSLFSLVLPEHAQGDSADPLNNPSLDCRMITIESAIGGGDLPECAGGEPKPKLMLEAAKANSLVEVQLTFNLGIDQVGAGDTSHYVIDPDAKIAKASLSKFKNFIIYLSLETELEPGKRYTVTVKDLTSYIDTELDPEHACTTFEVQKS